MVNFFKKAFSPIYIPQVFKYLVAYILGVLSFEFCINLPATYFDFAIAPLSMSGVELGKFGAGNNLMPLILSLSKYVAAVAIFFYLLNYYSNKKQILLLFVVCGLIRSTISHLEYLKIKNLESNTLTLTGHISDSYKLNTNRLPHVLNIKISQGPLKNYHVIIRSSIKSDFEIDDLVKIENILIKNINNKNFALKEKVVANLFVNKFNCTLLNRPSFSPTRILYKAKSLLLNNFATKFNSQTFSLFSSLFLGKSTVNSEANCNMRDIFNFWGISHYLARSGLHVALIIIVWNLLLSLLWIPFFKKQVFIMFLLALYHILTYTSISFFRALLAILFYRIIILNNKISHSFNTVSLVCLIIILYNPIYLFSLDFQLSFLLAFALSWINEIKLLKSLNKIS